MSASDFDDNRRPEDIENDIRRTRAEVSSTIDAIQSKLKPPRQMVNEYMQRKRYEAVSYLRTSSPAYFGVMLKNTVRDNPLPVSLIGAGVAWLMMSERQRSRDGMHWNRPVADYGYDDDYDRSVGLEYDSSYRAYGAYGVDSRDRGRDREGMMSRAASRVSETGQGLKEKASEVGQRLSETTSEMTERTREMTHQARDRMYETAGAARARVGENPIPAAMIGIGLAWMMMSGRQQSRESRSAADYEYDGYGRSGSLDYDASYDTSYGSYDTGGRDRDGMMSRATSRVGETGQGLKEKASEVGQRLSETTSGMTERTREMTHQARDRMYETAEAARARLSRLGQRSQQQYYRTRNEMSHVIDEQPLLLGALGIAVGAALGAMLPGTRREDELMGRVRDDLVESAKETAREGAETVKESAMRVAHAAEEVARVAGDAAPGRSQGNGHANRPSASGGTDDSKPRDSQQQGPR